jgi:hypothetical protein
MIWFFIEMGVALLLLIVIVWWTMPRKRGTSGERPGSEDRGPGNDAPGG